jgi:RNA recognition motif-containing protein
MKERIGSFRIDQVKGMGTRLYVGNLPYSTDDKQLRALFEEVGQPPREVRIITDRMTGQSRGFAFVEVADATAAQAAISALNGHPFGGRTLTVNEARDRESGPRPPGGTRPPGGPRGNGAPGGYPPREGGPPRSFGGPPRGFGGPPRPGDRPASDRDRDRDRFERKKQKRRRDDYGDDDGY